MASEARLRQRGGRWYFVAWVPKCVREHIPGGAGGQKWIALGTSDYATAKRLVRLKSVEFDRQVEAARKKSAGAFDTITRDEARRLAALWEREMLEQDEE